ncbi:biogenesis of lysosome-related organelles complex 1 subunit 2 [Prunus dulcis]|uniref:biogenesis of lysosome-related organelles complex 1 subunit 2 n=1 Tax=Prunus dulcis TaxID=3755 RepID=UPI0014831185|nr:biogenesis of lysosome-related organelles complex 1 subunit 2 [Prunus dulcis]
MLIVAVLDNQPRLLTRGFRLAVLALIKQKIRYWPLGVTVGTQFRMAAKEEQDKLAESLNDLFTSVSTMVKSELQGSTNHLDLLEKMNLRVAEEYKGFGDVASGLSVFVEQLKSKSGSFEEYAKQIDVIEQQVTEFEAVISVLDRYVSMLESKVQSVYQNPSPC